MYRALALATLLTAGAALPAMAAEDAAPAADAAAAQTYYAEIAAKANANELRKLLTAKGYTSISELNRDSGGSWTGTAVKDGKKVVVSVKMPPKPASEPNTN